MADGHSTTYHIENAASGRAKCKKCKEPIAKGELRIATNSVVPGKDFALTSYHKVKCFQIPPRSMKGVSPEAFVADHLVDLTDKKILSDEVKRREVVDDIAYKPPKKGAKKKGGDDDDDNGDDDAPSNAVGKRLKEIKAVMSNLPETEDDDKANDDEEDERPTKKSKTDDIEAYAKAMRLYFHMKNDDLKAVLRWNLGYATSGNKDVLLLRCIDGHVNGRIARCPTCFIGKLHLKDEDAGATVICKGYYDEDMARRIPCGYAVPAASAPRLMPWYINEPSDAQIEAMKATTEEHEALGNGKAGGTSSGGNAVVPAELLLAAGDIDEGRWEDADTKTKAQLIVDVGTSGKTRLDLPQDEKKARIAVGKMILSNPDGSAVDILKLAMNEFGVATIKEEAKARQKSAMESACVVPANAGIVQVFQELGDYYFKEGNPNAGSTYKKAITAISSLDYAITEENAKGLGKGKTKLAGIGKGTADKIHEFFSTGTIQKLVEKRAIHS